MASRTTARQPTNTVYLALFEAPYGSFSWASCSCSTPSRSSPGPIVGRSLLSSPVLWQSFSGPPSTRPPQLLIPTEFPPLPRSHRPPRPAPASFLPANTTRKGAKPWEAIRHHRIPLRPALPTEGIGSISAEFSKNKHAHNATWPALNVMPTATRPEVYAAAP